MGSADRGSGCGAATRPGPGSGAGAAGAGSAISAPATQPVRDPETLARIKALVIPPAWEDVWICAEPGGHIQAVGTDAAGRRQYRYHDLWRERRDRDKHDRVLEFGRVLPRLREHGHRAPGRPWPAAGAGPGRGGPPDRPRLLPARRRGVRGGERHLRHRHDPPRARDLPPRRTGLRLPRQGRQAAGAGRGGRRRPGGGGQPAAAQGRRGRAVRLPVRPDAGTT